MKLATAADVTTRMGSNVNMGNIATAAESVLEAATPIIENILGTPLASADRIDWFSYNDSIFDTPLEVEYNLTQAFVEGTVTFYYSEGTNPVLRDFSNATAVDSAYVDLDEEAGRATLYSIPNTGTSVVAARYSAGFTEGSTEIPDWLREAAIAAAVRVIHSHTLGHNKDDISQVAPELHRILMMVLNNHIRTRLHGIFPNRTKVL
jgi:hypothetical protein